MKFIKTVFCLLLALSMILCFTACNDSDGVISTDTYGVVNVYKNKSSKIVSIEVTYAGCLGTIVYSVEDDNLDINGFSIKKNDYIMIEKSYRFVDGHKQYFYKVVGLSTKE